MSEKRQNLTIVGLLILLLIGCAVLFVVRDFRLGLDLRGGVEVVLDARPLPGQTVTQTDLNTSTSILRRPSTRTARSRPRSAAPPTRRR